MNIRAYLFTEEFLADDIYNRPYNNNNRLITRAVSEYMTESEARYDWCTMIVL